MTTLERVTVNFIPAASRALAELAETLELSKTDVLNRAVQLYLYVQRTEADGGQLLVRDSSGSLQLLKIL